MAVSYNLFVEQGADFYHELFVYDDDGDLLNLTGYEARAQFRRSYRSETATDFDIEIGDQEVVENRGKIILRLEDADSMELRPGRYVYDLEIESTAGNVIRVVEGIVTLSPNVTRTAP